MIEAEVEETIGNQDWIDRAADPLHQAVASILEKTPRIASVLHGNFLGHPLHAVITDIPIGAWTVGLLMDVLTLSGARKLRGAADLTTIVGLVGASAAVLPGLADWSTTTGATKRIGFVHMSTNIVVSGLYGASLLARASKKRGLGVALSMIGFGLVGFSGWLGGELAYKHGVGMRPEAIPRGRSSRRRIEETRPAEPVRSHARA